MRILLAQKSRSNKCNTTVLYFLPPIGAKNGSKGVVTMTLYLICDTCGQSQLETCCSYYMDDDGFIAVICFNCQPSYNVS